MKKREDFTRESVTLRLEEKMKRRHPHLFGLGEREDWEEMKVRERGEGTRVLDGLATGLDPLLRAHRIQDRVSGVGFDWSDAHGSLGKGGRRAGRGQGGPGRRETRRRWRRSWETSSSPP